MVCNFYLMLKYCNQTSLSCTAQTKGSSRGRGRERGRGRGRERGRGRGRGRGQTGGNIYVIFNK